MSSNLGLPERPMWEPAEAASTVRRVPSTVQPASQLPPGGDGIRTCAEGMLRGDLLSEFEAIGTSFGMVTANAFKILARNCKSTLLDLLNAPPRQCTRERLESIAAFWLHKLQPAEQQVLASNVLISSAIASSSAAQSSTGIPNLAKISFDALIEAVCFIEENQSKLKMPNVDARTVIDDIYGILGEVFNGELSAGEGADPSPLADVIRQWRHVHVLSISRNQAGVHPLDHVQSAAAALPLYRQAVEQAHPILRSVSLLAPASLQAAQNVLKELQIKEVANVDRAINTFTFTFT